MAPTVHLVPGRNCGKCNACCRYYDVAELKKPAGQLCQHWKKSSGCTIYETRPAACRDFYCVWLQNASMDDGWRPDLSGFILRETYSNIPAHFAVRHGVVFELCGPNSSINTDRFIQAVASQVAQRVPVFLSITREQRISTVFLNDRIEAAVASRQRPALVAALTAALADAEQGIKHRR